MENQKFMDPQTYLNKIPQSVLVSDQALDFAKRFVQQWAANLLKTSVEQIEKHPDYHAIRPLNKMRQINVDALREMNHDVYTSAQQQGRKVFVIYEADRLNLAAANALLKTLEEPTADSSIFFVTVKPYDILPTLRSRCWWVQLNTAKDTFQDESLQSWLQDFQILVLSYLKSKTALSPLKIYGLLYRLQDWLTQKGETITVDDETLSEEEVLAQKAREEKQNIQTVFRALEGCLSDILPQANTFININEWYPRWVSDLEHCFSRTEVNLGAIPALEAFLLQFCNPSPL